MFFIKCQYVTKYSSFTKFSFLFKSCKNYIAEIQLPLNQEFVSCARSLALVMDFSITGFGTPMNSTLNQAGRGGGVFMPAALKIACHILQDHAKDLKHLNFFKNDVGPNIKNHLEHILNDCPENGPSSTKISENFEAKIINFDFFQNFD